jgi:hypothetical protein
VESSDLRFSRWTPESYPQLVRWSWPMTLGHENAGWLESGEPAGLEVRTPVVYRQRGVVACVVLASLR